MLDGAQLTDEHLRRETRPIRRFGGGPRGCLHAQLLEFHEKEKRNKVELCYCSMRNAAIGSVRIEATMI